MLAPRLLVRSLTHSLVALSMAGLGTAWAGDVPAPTRAEPLHLQKGVPIEREIRVGEPLTFDLELSAGTFLFLEISPRGMKLSSKLLNGAREIVAIAESSEDPWSQLLVAVVDQGGIYRLEVNGSGPPGLAGRCGLRVREIRPAISGTDSARVQAAKTLAEARQLRNQGKPAQAETLLEESLVSWRKAGDARGELEILLESADLYSDLGKPEKALAFQKESLAQARKSESAECEARALSSLATLEYDQKKFADAADGFNRSLQIWQRMGGPFEQAVQLQRLGNVYRAQEDHERARQAFADGLPLARDSGVLSLQARALNGVGSSYYRLGRPREALENWEEALKLSRQAGDRGLEAVLEQNEASLYINQGQYQKAFNLLIHAVSSVPPEKAGTMRQNLGNLYLDLGDPDKARDNYELSRKAFASQGKRQEEADVRIAIGRTWQRKGELQAALAEYEEARKLMPKSWGVLYSIGAARMELEKPEQALGPLQQALATPGLTPDQRALTQLALGTLHTKLNHVELATQCLDETIRLADEIGYTNVMALGFLRRARLRRSQDLLAKAQEDAEAALKIVESARLNVGGDQLRTEFFAVRRSYYDLLIDLLMRQGSKDQALKISEQARARGLLDLLAEGRIDVRQGVDPDLRRREEDLAFEISQAHLELRAGKAKPERAQALRARLGELAKQQDQLDVEIRAKNKRYAEVRYPVPLTRPEIQERVLDDRSALLEYALGEDSSTLFVLTREGLSTYPLPSAGKIAEKVQRLRGALEEERFLSRTTYLELGSQLYDELIAPASAALAGKTDLLIAPDGALYYVPFEALLTEPAGNRKDQDLPYLVHRYSVAYIPSASVLADLREPRQESLPVERKEMVAFAPFAAPVASRGAARGVAQPPAGPGTDRWDLLPLPASRREVSEVTGLYPGAALSLVGAEATEAAARGPLVNSAHRLHFATHAMIDEHSPENSALVLAEGGGEDGLLRVPEIFNLKLSADLAVLSACQTARGKEVTGEGLVGLSRAFFYAGVPSLVVSLWNVTDNSTPDLMRDFYQDLDRLHDKARALQSAKRAMISRGTYSHPSYWAPFILVGEPR